jgi:hypothetical protein
MFELKKKKKKQSAKHMGFVGGKIDIEECLYPNTTCST